MKKRNQAIKKECGLKGIKAGSKIITVTNPSKELLQRFEELKGKQFESLQDFIQALEATKRVNNNSIHQNKKSPFTSTDKS